ncbi:MAG: phosphoribosylanthranilate isomerase [Acholeplasmatales bacterium]|nr:phosphoribosylanthranilate isomerase [Acholeplasmatales bacterium]
MLVKTCGLRRIEDIKYANELKPDFIGFVFAKSKRQVSIDEAKILKDMLDNNIKCVGVFRNDDIKLIKEVLDSNIIDIIQLHGSEDDEYIKEIKSFTNLPIIKAYRDSSLCEYSLFDNVNPGEGIKFDWSTIKSNKPYFLAGGINLDNLNDALNHHPYCIDVSSGIETNGFKDYDKMKEFIKRCRDYE